VVDDAGGKILVHCHAGCDQGAVIAALQARQLWPSGPARTRARTAESTLQDARRRILEEARRQPWAREGVVFYYSVSDWLRSSRRRVQELRRFAGHVDSDSADDIRARAARLETLAHAIEAELDEILAEGRIT
jgi:hypothetical protein